MIKVSSEFLQTMQDRTNFRCYGSVLLADGSQIDLTPDDFVLGGTRYRDGAESSGFPLGAAICRSIEIELMDDTERFADVDFFGAQIALSIALPLAETIEEIDLGTFTVNTPASYGNTVAIEAFDAMWQTDKQYVSTLTFPTTLSALYRDVCDAADIPYHTAVFRNSDYVVQALPLESYTQREMLGFIAMIAGGNARVGRDGYMEIVEYDFTKLSEDNSDIQTLYGWDPSSLVLDANDITITGLRTTATITGEDGESADQTIVSGEKGYMLDIVNPLISEDATAGLDLIAASIVGATFRKFEGRHIAYPLAEFMDPIKLADRKGNIYYSFITDIEFMVGGATEFSNSADSAIRTGSRYTSPATSAVIEAARLVKKEQTARETQIAQINAALSGAGGMFETTESQSDGSTIRYLHNKPELAESTTVLKLTSEAIGISNDGGKTYSYALAFTGEAVLATLAAEGVEAEWIKADDLSAISASLAGWNIDESGIWKEVTQGGTKYLVRFSPPVATDADNSAILSGQKLPAGSDTYVPAFSLLSNGALMLADGRLYFYPEGSLHIYSKDYTSAEKTWYQYNGVITTDESRTAQLGPSFIGTRDSEGNDAYLTPGGAYVVDEANGNRSELSPQDLTFWSGEAYWSLLEELGNRVSKSGDTMTGPLKIEDSDNYPSVYLVGADGKTLGILRADLYKRVYFAAYSENSNYYERFYLPTPDAELNGNKSYNILTNKTPVTIAQGGTNGTDAFTATDNLMTLFLGNLTGTANNLASGTDLDDITNGNFRSGSATVSASLVNAPTTSTGFRLIAGNLTTASSYVQVAIGYSVSVNIWVRVKTSSWGEWKKLSFA